MSINRVRTATAVLKVHIGNVKKNVEEIEAFYQEYQEKADVLLTPELSMTGYTCGDLFGHRKLLEDAKKGLIRLAKTTQGSDTLLLVGVPVEKDNVLYNCAAILGNGEIKALVPKTFLPNYNEFYERRWFSPYHGEGIEEILLEDKTVPFGNQMYFEFGEGEEAFRFGIELCEDLWTPLPPSTNLALAGAEIIFNLSASNEVIGKEEYRRSLVCQQSARCICGYVYCSAGLYESTSDNVFGGHCMIAENGSLITENEVFDTKNQVLLADINLQKIRHDRLVNKSFADCKMLHQGTKPYMKISLGRKRRKREGILQKISLTPFVPKDPASRCLKIFAMQVAGLQRRLLATKSKCVVVGVSGGLDSTLALLVSAQAVRNLGLPSTTVVGITMPGFGTTQRTKSNSIKLMELLGCDIRTISIADSVRQHFKDIGHDETVKDITYENCQARERTQILMDVANKEGGFVIGTGDLSELVLGWCTYNGDHMSMYSVNNSIPKTLVRTLVREIGYHMAKESESSYEELREVITDIIDTPVSPELLPPNEDGTIAQKTEDTVGSYVLHDFFLYYTLRFGSRPKEVFALCKEAVKQSEEYRFCDDEILKWLKVFYTRFFRQQFKRNCMPDGVKVGTVSVSPRGDLRLPSEVELEEFLAELDEM